MKKCDNDYLGNVLFKHISREKKKKKKKKKSIFKKNCEWKNCMIETVNKVLWYNKGNKGNSYKLVQSCFAFFHNLTRKERKT